MGETAEVVAFPTGKMVSSSGTGSHKPETAATSSNKEARFTRFQGTNHRGFQQQKVKQPRTAAEPFRGLLRPCGEPPQGNQTARSASPSDVQGALSPGVVETPFGSRTEKWEHRL